MHQINSNIKRAKFVSRIIFIVAALVYLYSVVIYILIPPQRAAKYNITPAHYNLGNMYALGQGVEKDEKRALECYMLGSEGGDPGAKFTLGTWYYTGRAGLSVDKKKSFELQSISASYSHPMAMFNVGTALLSGEGCVKDERMAAMWYHKAAEKGVIKAVINLANMYRIGQGVERDMQKSLDIFTAYSHVDLCRDFAKQVKEQMEHEKRAIGKGGRK